MASTVEPSTNTPAAEVEVPAHFARKATGLVRQLPLSDVILFNASSTTPIGASLSFGLFFALSLYAGANIILALVITMVGGVFVWTTFALMAATIPKVGGDYVYVGRVLHPALGLGGNLGAFVGSALAAGAYATWFVTIGLVPEFQIIGTITGNKWWLNAGTTLSSKGWVFGIGLAVILLLSILSILGTKLVVRTMNIMYAVAFLGLAISVIALLFTSHTSFVNHLNKFSTPFTHNPDSYHQTIAAGSKAGIDYPNHGSGWNFKSTMGTIFVAYGLIIFAWWSVYMAAEMKGAGRRKRQLTSMLGAGLGQGILLVVIVAIFFKTVGYNFLSAANAGHYGVPVSPYYNFFASITIHSQALAILLGFLFLAWFLPGCYINLAMGHRAPFAWAFDGLIPPKVAEINDRTHTPVVSIAIFTVLAIGATAWAAFSANFFRVLASATLVALVPIALTGIAAFVGQKRRPEIFRDSAAEWKIGGVGVFRPAGALCAFVGLFGIFDAIYFHEQIGVSVQAAIGMPAGLIVLAFVWYYAVRARARRHGVDLELVYKTIPPD